MKSHPFSIVGAYSSVAVHRKHLPSSLCWTLLRMYYEFPALQMRKLRSERLISRGEFQAQGSDFDGCLWNHCCRVIHSDALSDQRLK